MSYLLHRYYLFFQGAPARAIEDHPFYGDVSILAHHGPLVDFPEGSAADLGALIVVDVRVDPYAVGCLHE